MIQHEPISVRLRDVEPLAPTLRRFVLEAADGGLLPTASAGAHVQLTLRGPNRTWKNAYSLVSPPEQRSHYEIIVRRAAHSRGGSAFLHAQVAGHVLDMAPPANLFPYSRIAPRHLLLSAGIGLTPFLSYLAALRAEGGRCALHHVCKADEAAVFARVLAPFGDTNVTIHSGRAALDLPGLLGRQGLDTHLYICGPDAFMQEAADAARALGWPEAKLHLESFGGDTSGAPFTAVLARSGLRVAVAEDQSLLEALEAAGVEAPCLCRGGACGACEVPVLDGEPEHRD
ncbi:MAG TPA: PDR/VanB family oxidoreductase, partial [Acetobacteraceae bacterium]|nr:PDR/VanB family oxidoreductase [Acetobacteraceae bacterium]